MRHPLGTPLVHTPGAAASNVDGKVCPFLENTIVSLYVHLDGKRLRRQESKESALDGKVPKRLF